MTIASDASSRFKTTAPETLRYAKLVKNQRDGKDWTPYYAVSGVISVSLQRDISLRNTQTAETWACSIAGGRGRASQTTHTHEYNTGGEQYGH